jgi:hypothetical protein
MQSTGWKIICKSLEFPLFLKGGQGGFVKKLDG